MKVLDFGIAQIDENAQKEQKLTQAGMVLGTPPYMSPEQFIGKGLDHRSDIYSIAVMAYEMLTGKLPWTAGSPGEWAIQHMTVMPYPIDQLPEGARAPQAMRAAIMQALAKTPEARFANLGDFYQAFSAGGALQGGTAMLQPQANPPTYTGAPGAMQALPSTGNQGQFRTSPVPMNGPINGPINGPMSGGVSGAYAGTQAAPAFAPSFDSAPLPAPMSLPPGPAYTPQPMAASGGGGGGRAIGIVLLLVLLLGGGGAAAFFLLGHKAASSNASDSGAAAAIAPDAAGAGAAPTDTVAPLEPLLVDAGHDAARAYVASTTAKTTSTTTSTPGIPAPPLPPTVIRCPVAACGESAAARARGHLRQANALAAACRAAGCVAP